MNASFTHTESGTPEAAWAAAGLERLPSLQAGATRLVVLAAHPDDESLGAGGLLAAAARRGAQIDVLVATDGEGSHPRSGTHTRDALATLRRREVRAAVVQVAPAATVHHLGLPDGGLDRCAAELDAALLAILGRVPVLLVTPWRQDRHPDHEACGAAGARAAGNDIELWEYPIWAWHWGDPAGPDLPRRSLHRLDLGPDELAAKRAALDEHASQRAPLSDAPGDEAILPATMLQHFHRPYECFVLDSGGG